MMCKMPTCGEGGMQAVLTGFSDIEIKQPIPGRVAHSTNIEQAILADVFPVKPGTVGVAQAARLAVVHGRGGRFWWGLIG